MHHTLRPLPHHMVACRISCVVLSKWYGPLWRIRSHEQELDVAHAGGARREQTDLPLRTRARKKTVVHTHNTHKHTRTRTNIASLTDYGRPLRIPCAEWPMLIYGDISGVATVCAPCSGVGSSCGRFTLHSCCPERIAERN
jgi:hypothetical protein